MALVVLVVLPACLLADRRDSYRAGYRGGGYDHYDHHDWHGYHDHDHYYYNNYYYPGSYYYSGYPQNYDIYPYYAPYYDTPDVGAGLQINLGG